jgi:hypothetical protein
MYEKKIRNRVEVDSDKPIDADTVYDEKIVRSWNDKWKNDLTKPVFLNSTTIVPRVVLSLGDGD